MPLSQADVVFKALDDSMKNEPGYDKTKFRIDFTMNGEADNYEGRQDFGDGDGSLIEHIQGYHEYYAQSESWKKSVIERTGIEGWEQEGYFCFYPIFPIARAFLRCAGYGIML